MKPVNMLTHGNILAATRRKTYVRTPSFCWPLEQSTNRLPVYVMILLFHYKRLQKSSSCLDVDLEASIGRSVFEGLEDEPLPC